MSPAGWQSGFTARPDAAGGARPGIRHRPRRAGVRDHRSASTQRCRSGIWCASSAGCAAAASRRRPTSAALWGEVVAIVSRIYRRKQYHNARSVTALLREFRRLTTAMPEGAVLLGPEHEILWFNHRAAQWLGLRRKRDFGIRIENLVRHPDFVDYLRTGEPGDGVVVQDASDIDALVLLPRRAHRHGGASAADRARRQPRAAAAVDAQGLRRECLARAALAADRDHRISRCARRRSEARSDLERADPRDAPPGRAHEHDHQRPAGAVEAGIRRAAARGEQPIDIAGHAGAAAQGDARARAAAARSAADARQRRTGSTAWRARCIRSSPTCCPTP